MTIERESEKARRNKRETQLFKGLSELALMHLLRNGPEYGLQILDRLRTEAGLDIAEGTLYPLLYRLEKTGLVAADWRIQKDISHPRKYYTLTPAGAAELKIQAEQWLSISDRLRTFLTGGGR
ncbi:PadR family transcriptional regulator [Tunturiibacter lichenicola]|uniref:PadR family transcriptional regulator n=1 Tax=Tunturiibacter lichenicola TaxID=2051959 RepID=UPI0021B2D40C|nr:PadR family transcriptional regulator [Edaphobacter lichenicola]